MVVAFIGPWEFLILLAIIVFLFGAKRFTAVGRNLGRGAREFKSSVEDEEGDSKDLPPTDRQPPA